MVICFFHGSTSYVGIIAQIGVRVKNVSAKACSCCVPSVCHPERSMKSRQYRAVWQILLFGISYVVEVLQNGVAMQRNEAKPPQAGSPMNLLNVCIALVTFLRIPYRLLSNVTLRKQACQKPFGDPFLVCALHKLVGFAPFHFAVFCEISKKAGENFHKSQSDSLQHFENMLY